MKGLDLAREYYKQIVKPIIEGIEYIKGNYACGLIGFGSDCLGNDDDYSTDHEWGPRCIIFLADALIEKKREIERLLERKIGDSFLGYPTRFIYKEDFGVKVLAIDGYVLNIEITTSIAYFKSYIGSLPVDSIDLLKVAENKLLELTSGEIFYDGIGQITKLRSYIKYYPLDVWQYRMAYMWQAVGWDIDLIGLCHKRGDTISTRIAINETVFRLIKLIFLYNKRYAPSYHKWIHRELYKLPQLSDELGPLLENCLIETDIDQVQSNILLVVNKMIKFHNNQPELLRIIKLKSQFSRGFIDIDFQHIANTIHKSIDGELAKIKLVGALDQFVTNQDLLLEHQELKKLAKIYEKN